MKRLDLADAPQPEAEMEPARHQRRLGRRRQRQVHARAVAHEHHVAVPDVLGEAEVARVEGLRPLDRADLQVQVVEVHRTGGSPQAATPPTRLMLQRVQSSSSAVTSLSIISSVWAGDGVKRSRSVPRGTVG